MTDREKILKLLADNREGIEGNLSEFWIRQAEDLTAVGVPLAKVAESLLTTAVAHFVEAYGADATATGLRNVADDCERHFSGTQAH